MWDFRKNNKVVKSLINNRKEEEIETKELNSGKYFKEEKKME